MADIQFEEDQEFSRQVETPVQSGFTQIVLRTGIVSNEKQAEYVLIGFAVLLIFISVYLAIPKSVAGTIKHSLGDELLVPGLRNK